VSEFKGEIPGSKVILPKFDNGHWIFTEQMGKDYVGFVYIIHDEYLNRAYIGKKLFYGTGVHNKGKDTGWKTYKSSSKLLAEMFRERPLTEFKFICLEQYKTKGTLAYAETWSLCFVEAPTTINFYNKLI
jgi:hypothetical protein